MPRAPRRVAAVLAVAGAAIASVALANGRPPYTNGVYFGSNDMQSIYVRTTFGFLISHDGGCSFSWTCEDSIGFAGTFDPAYAVGPDGTLYATTYAGLRVSHDGGCTFAFAPDLFNQYTSAISLGSNGDVWVTTETAPYDVYRSTDGGTTFASTGMASPGVLWNSVLVAPSDPLHAYVTGYEQLPPGVDAGAASAPHFYSTADGGSNWTASPLAGVQYGEQPLVTLEALDPANPLTVYIASVGATPPGDTLYRSTDGGSNFSQVLVTPQPIVSVLVLDATTVLVAEGTNAAGGGLYRSTDGGATFAAVPNAPQLVCLGQRPDGTLIGCAANWDPDFMAVTSSTDGGATWSKMFRFVDLDGVLDCPAGTIDHDDCQMEEWPTIQQQFGATGPSCATATDLPPVDASPEPDNAGKPGGGCCNTGDGSPLGVGLLAGLVVLGLVGMRARGRQPTDRSR